MSLKNRKVLVHITTVPATLKFLEGQLTFMSSKGFEVHIISSPGDLLKQIAMQENVEAHDVEMHRSITPLKDIFALFKLWLIFRNIKPTIVHAHTPKGGLLGMIAAWLSGVKIRIYHIHGLPYLTKKGFLRLILMLSERISSFFANSVLCVSHSIRQIAIEDGICHSSKTSVLLKGSINGIDANKKFSPKRISESERISLKKKYKIPQNAQVIGFIGRLVKEKGLVELVQSWEIIKKQFPGVHLLVVGEFEHQDSVPPNIVKILMEEPNIHLTGFIEDIVPIYSIIDVLAFPSHREGFGLVAIEAAAMKVPVVATTIPGCFDSVKDGETGILVPPGNTKALTEAISNYLKNKELCKIHGELGRKRVLNDFKQELIWDRMYKHYLTFIANMN